MSYLNIPAELRELNQWVDVIKAVFNYNIETGIVTYNRINFGEKPTRKEKQWNTVNCGRAAGFMTDHGYLRVSFYKKKFYIHQIAFIITKGYVPIEIDHIDSNKTNNKWSNLRECSHSENVANCTKRKTNKSGLKGVSWTKSNNCWRMDIQFKNKKYHSLHPTKELAYDAYCQMSKELHKEFGNVR